MRLIAWVRASLVFLEGEILRCAPSCRDRSCIVSDFVVVHGVPHGSLVLRALIAIINLLGIKKIVVSRGAGGKGWSNQSTKSNRDEQYSAALVQLEAYDVQ